MKSFCISHIKDVDGLGAAGIVRAATGAEVLLSDYDTLMEDLGRVPPDTEQFVLCDLGADNSNIDEFIGRLGKIARKAKTTYIDHHFMSPSTKRRIKAAGVRLVHDDKECSSMLAYLTFRKELPERARMIALCGAVTDYMDGSPKGKKMMEQADRQFILLEASMLSFALGRKGTADGFPQKVAAELALMKHPHEIEGVPIYAVEQLAEVEALGKEVKTKGKKVGRLAYMVTTQYSTGNIAKLLIGVFEVPAGVALKQKQKGWYEVSLRGTSECRVHLGKTIDRIANRLGGNGGGHRLAAGCRIPVGRLDEMLELLRKKV